MKLRMGQINKGEIREIQYSESLQQFFEKFISQTSATSYFIPITISVLTVIYMNATGTYHNRTIPVTEEKSPLYIFIPFKKTFTVNKTSASIITSKYLSEYPQTSTNFHKKSEVLRHRST